MVTRILSAAFAAAALTAFGLGWSVFPPAERPAPAPAPQAASAPAAPPPAGSGTIITSFTVVRVPRPDNIVMYRFAGTVNAPSPQYYAVVLYANGRMVGGTGVCDPSGRFSGDAALRYGIDRDWGPGDVITAVAVDTRIIPGPGVDSRTAVVP